MRTFINKLFKIGKGNNLLNKEENLNRVPVYASLNKNIEWFKEELNQSDDLIVREFENCDLPGLKGAILFLEGMADINVIQDNLLEPLLRDLILVRTLSEDNCPEEEEIQKKIIPVAGISSSSNLNMALDSLLAGNTVLVIDGISEVYIFVTKGGEKRAVSEPKNEKIIRGPKIGFVEELSTNVSLVRRRRKNSNLVVKKITLGTEVSTEIALMYHKEKVIKPVFDELMIRLEKVNLERVEGTGTIEQAIEDAPYSIFPQFQYTERPDKVAASISEGRIAIIIDGTPIVMLIPAPLPVFFQTTDDYQEKWFFGTVLRWTRYLSAFISSSLPALYIAVISYHPELLPTDLAFSIGVTRLSVPFPAYVEALMMEFVLEVLQEAGIRLPAPVTQTVSIVGGLVIGQAAVQAGIISPIMVIVISVTAISSYTIPSYNLNLATRILRIPLIIASVVLGFYGLVLAWLIILIHLCKLTTMNESYLEGITPINKSSLDVIIRAPLRFVVKKFK